MYSPDYAKDVSVKANEKQIPMVIGLLALIIVLAGSWFGFNLVKTYMPIDEPVVKSNS